MSFIAFEYKPIPVLSTCVPQSFLKNISLLFRNLVFSGHYILETKIKKSVTDLK